jgi:hypothetical protein
MAKKAEGYSPLFFYGYLLVRFNVEVMNEED